MNTINKAENNAPKPGQAPQASQPGTDNSTPAPKAQKSKGMDNKDKRDTDNE